MDLYIRDENLKRYRKALADADTVVHRAILSALITHLEDQEPVTRMAYTPSMEGHRDVSL
ncbi:hypothetical protein BJ122_10321 [Rhodopseudomonas faecalis]|uniref:Uncharacterized protein n=1 Tax=Rhodopseudomonas faecalis TaxID=99655 RepID=A0A318TMX2_9BRAD|nr:hypothetical protein [Rhodopseudomonas faecalis]PYF04368.1 hypothetical protein BJ122_10321 [Rhodopseudomonas faecalis]TAH65050.1 MAG: hypothetical protein EWM45_16480 [Rhodopseudomonas palustris]